MDARRAGWVSPPLLACSRGVQTDPPRDGARLLQSTRRLKRVRATMSDGAREPFLLREFTSPSLLPHLRFYPTPLLPIPCQNVDPRRQRHAAPDVRSLDPHPHT